MPDYFVLGGCLRSELTFPELAESRDRAPDWTLTVGTLAPDNAAEVLADSNLSPTCRIRVSVRDGHLRYYHSCAGTFEIAPNGREIVFDAAASHDLNAARNDLVARLLLYCVDRRNIAWLHGSGVRIENAAVAFLGRSGAGKSTLALALAHAGCEHVCDDVLPISCSDQPTIWSSDDIIRLHDDSKSRLALKAPFLRRESDGKFLLSHRALDGARSGSALPAAGRIPLSAIYILDPVAPNEGTTRLIRSLLQPRTALPLLIQHLKLPTVVRSDDPARAMKQLGVVAAAVPVYSLRVPRDWSALSAAVTQIVKWHCGSPVEPAVSLPGEAVA
jgi:hypothetical protein